MSITNPDQLVQAFKSSGEFARLRRELFAEFEGRDDIEEFKARAETIFKERLIADQKLRFNMESKIHEELMEEINRRPVVTRAVDEVPSLANGSLLDTIHTSAHRVLQESRGIRSASKSPVKSVGSSQSTPLRAGGSESPNKVPLDRLTTPMHGETAVVGLQDNPVQLPVPPVAVEAPAPMEVDPPPLIEPVAEPPSNAEGTDLEPASV